MPIGFIILGIFLIFVLMYEPNITKKTCYVAFLIFAMLGYVINPLIVGNISINVIFLVLCCVAIVGLLNVNKDNLVKLSILVLSVAIAYIMITKINSAFVVAINPYPVCFLIMLLSVFNLQQFNFVLLFNIASFFIINVINLVAESWLGMVHFCSVGFFNLTIVMIAILFLFNLILKNLKILKRGD